MQKGKYKLGIEREAERSTSLHKTNKQTNFWNIRSMDAFTYQVNAPFGQFNRND